MLLSFCISINAQNETVTNETIISLLKDGFGTEEIIGFVDAASTRTVTMSLTDMKALKEAGADAELIKYIQKIAKTDFGYEGVLWWNPSDGGKPKKLYRTAFEKEKKGFNGGFLGAATAVTGVVMGNSTGTRLASGVAGAAIATTAADFQKLVLQGANARVVLSGENATKPVFRFFFPKKDTESFEKTAESWYFTMMSDVQSPNEFQCIKMKQKKSKRTFPDGTKYTVAGFSSSTNNKNIVNFEINEINNNTFEVSFPEALEPGEYIFFYKNGLNNKYFQENVFGFDFSVQ